MQTNSPDHRQHLITLTKVIMIRKNWYYLLIMIFFCIQAPANAGPADVVDVTIRKTSRETYDIAVTVQHQDEDWDHYADRWEILGPDGTILATRILQHPHVHEQPFTRSLSGVRLPASLQEITIRAHDKRHGHSGKTMTVALPKR